MIIKPSNRANQLNKDKLYVEYLYMYKY